MGAPRVGGDQQHVVAAAAVDPGRRALLAALAPGRRRAAGPRALDPVMALLAVGGAVALDVVFAEEGLVVVHAARTLCGRGDSSPPAPSLAGVIRALLSPALVAGLLVVPAGASADARFWVSPRGSDANPGTKAAPFASLQRAQRAVRPSLERHADADVQVILRGGTYRLEKPFKLTSRDSAQPRDHVGLLAPTRRPKPIISGAERVPRLGLVALRPRRGHLAGSGWRRPDPRALRQRTARDPSRNRRLPAGFLPSWNDGGADTGMASCADHGPDRAQSHFLGRPDDVEQHVGHRARRWWPSPSGRR